jgi:hypothetical protein
MHGAGVFASVECLGFAAYIIRPVRKLKFKDNPKRYGLEQEHYRSLC